ncbi:N-acetylmuramoyl-L-alanine amidase [Psychroserpens damuponensis]|uniref:N-acetylmuramoyl-L-alanine amidase n=1 Tax=Psychroserpens damuponensis TaxID=943936 RepID=UPI00058D14E3|nr:N-acetylmuramoyl-L-alanine amidase [Psychroserpens damuponensis]
MIDYIFYTIISLGCSFLVYYLLLKNQKTFQFNRFYLLISSALCLLAPILEISTIESVPSLTEISLQSFEAHHVSEAIEIIGTPTATTTSSFTLSRILWSIYVIISICLLFRFFKNLFGIIKLTKQNYSRIGPLKIVETSDHKNASSFFNYLFINSESLNDEPYSKSIIQHELVHCNELHTLDVIFIELLLCVFWFNPFIWLYKGAIIQNHEFIADSQTVNSGIDIEVYSQTIIKSGLKEYRVPLTSGFNFIQIKNRIIMLHQLKSSLLNRTLKISSVIILFAGILLLSSYKDLKEPLLVVIDAGHGGKDSGNSNEKDIVLEITNALASLSDDNVEIILTRSHDEFLTLKDRAEFVNRNTPDLFLSLHCNASQNKSINGVEAYYDSNNEHHDLSLNYAEILVEHQLELFESRGVKRASFFLLKNTTVPGLVLEIGFLTNEGDRVVLTDKEKQIEIAKSLYEGLLEIRDLQ